MSDEGTQWDAPNQQVVRPDESAPWDEGDGGTEHPGPKAEPVSSGESSGQLHEETEEGYYAMTKVELLDLARARGISPANNDMSKAELIAGLEAAD